ncbi:hypothetical protein [Pedobacter helvus]|uniref:Uncharacterized protein n=1 Tax=Pedobacter helvus TaxID=2563444 RepID=A0ABW9JDR4_9SPHI|nr:hypothetical protein [Pedobacter ureilyticus]
MDSAALNYLSKLPGTLPISFSLDGYLAFLYAAKFLLQHPNNQDRATYVKGLC